MKNFYILLLILIVSLIFGCSSKVSDSELVDKSITEPVSESKNKLDSTLVTECDEKQDIIEKDLCYFNLALDNVDDSFCDKISGTQPNESAIIGGVKKDSCYILISIENPEDLAICEKIQNTEDKELCYRRVAVKKKDPSICDLIQRDPNPIKEKCFMDVAIEKKDVSICNKNQVQIWKNLCFTGVAIAKKDSSICDLISDEEAKDTCHKNIEQS